jgi:hypothetical protein
VLSVSEEGQDYNRGAVRLGRGVIRELNELGDLRFRFQSRKYEGIGQEGEIVSFF